jgi:hypothetical protein
MAAVGGRGPAAAHRVARGVERVGEAAEVRREQRLEPQAELLGEAGRGAGGADRDEHRVAVEHARDGEIAEVGAVGDVDQHAARLEPDRGQLGPLERDEGETRLAVVVLDDDAAGAFDEAALGLGGLPVPQHDHRLAGDLVEEREGSHRVP